MIFVVFSFLVSSLLGFRSRHGHSIANSNTIVLQFSTATRGKGRARLEVLVHRAGLPVFMCEVLHPFSVLYLRIKWFEVWIYKVSIPCFRC